MDWYKGKTPETIDFLSGEDFPGKKNNPLRDGEILLTEENHMNIYLL
jgi:hypothetical protein